MNLTNWNVQKSGHATKSIAPFPKRGWKYYVLALCTVARGAHGIASSEKTCK